MDNEAIPAKCQRVIDEINKRNLVGEGSAVIDVSRDCWLHHFVHKTFWQDGQDKPDARLFECTGLSVVATGGSFESLDPKEELKSFCEKMQAEFVGAVSFKVGDLMDNFRFRILHDPYPCGDIEPPRNHVQIICKKATSIREELHRICIPTIKPGDQ